MLKPNFTASFNRDVKLLKNRGKDMKKLKDAIILLCSEIQLPPQYRDHPLKGRFAGYRECHLEFDWLLMYKKEKDKMILLLSRTGTHPDIFGS